MRSYGLRAGTRTVFAGLAAVALTVFAQNGTVSAQSWGPRTLEQLKVETQRRVDNGLGPVGGVTPEDGRRALAMINDLDPETWAGAWSKIGEEYMQKAEAAADTDAKREAYRMAWENFNIGRWPSEKLAPGKRHAYERALDAFQAYGALLDPPVETVHIPFEDSELVGYIRVPKGVEKPPIVIGINGLDSRKEDFMAETDAYMNNGVAAFTIDMPGTGQSPVLIDVGSERVFSAAIDYLLTREDVDGSRIAIQGRSWSGYWAAVVAYTEKDRIKGAAVHGAGLHDYYSREWQETALLSEEYLFDLFPARSAVYGVKTMEEFLAYGPKLSLLARGLADQPSAPMLVVNGAQDTQQPISDVFMLLQHGDPKDAWVNPTGGHMGRNKEWPMGRVLSEVVEPWLMRKLGVEPKASMEE